jgi:hypothetical protein
MQISADPESEGTHQSLMTLNEPTKSVCSSIKGMFDKLCIRWAVGGGKH